MLSDSEILDNKTQSLDEALQKLEANREQNEAGPVSSTVHDVLNDENLEIAVECVQTLADLYATVSQEGISSYDVQTLRAVQSKMNAISEVGAPKVALERYEGMFTPERSGLNQKVSIEAIQVEFMRIVKEWFYKLVDFVVGVVNAVIRLKDHNFMVDRRNEQIKGAVVQYRAQLRELMKLNAWGDRDLRPEFKAIQETLLRDPKLPHNKLTLMGFGTSQLDKDFQRELKTINSFSVNFKKVVDGLAVTVEKGDDSNVTTTFFGRILEDAVKTLEEFTVEDPDPDYFFKAPMLKGLDLMQPKYFLERTPYYMATWYTLLDDSVKSLKRIKRFNAITDEAAVDRVAASIADINIGIKAIHTVAKTISELNVCQFKVGATFINYYINCHEVVMEDFKNHRFDDLQRVAIDKAAKAWDKITSDLGLFG